jgi:NADP-dependent 3-hydroxy acid dehydrogenase YdfG
MGELTGTSVIITGASRGIGAATAEAMAAAGARLMLLARDGAAVEALAGRLGDARAMACDVADFGQVAAAVAATRAAFGRVDELVNNAGVIDPIGPLATSDPESWGRATDTNFKGVYNGMRAALPVMLAQGAGTVLTVGSGAAHNPLEGWSQYCASKAAAFMLTRCLHLEARGRGIRAISLSPGTVATDMQRRIRASGINAVSQMDFAAHIPPEMPARALVWLATDAAAEFAGEEVSLRDPAFRARIGLAA